MWEECLVGLLYALVIQSLIHLLDSLIVGRRRNKEIVDGLTGSTHGIYYLSALVPYLLHHWLEWTECW